MWCILIVLAGLIAYGSRAAEEPCEESWRTRFWWRECVRLAPVMPSGRSASARGSTPGKAKRLVRKASIRADWDETKSAVMQELLQLKCRQES
jgi:hypothetical protein